MKDTLYILADSTTINVDESKPKSIKLDNYQVNFDNLLGKGSFSSVYECRDGQGKKAAVKILKKFTSKSQHIIKVAKAQTKFLRKIKHPNIVGYISSYQSANNYYILFQYCEGKTLRQLLNLYKCIDIMSVINIAIGLIDAMCYLHDKNIMHRDIKPDNVKYFKTRTILIDFGFACQINGDKTMLKQSIGTPSYMSIEMLQKKSYGLKSDIWSLGILLYEITYGRLPWQGRNQSELCQIIVRNSLQFPQQPKIPNQLRHLIAGCLEKNPVNRIDFKILQRFATLLPHAQIPSNNKSDSSICSFFCWP